MKKYLVVLLSVIMAFCMFSCGSSEKAEGGVPEIKTLGDVFELETEDYSDVFDERSFGCAFRYNGRVMHVAAEMPEGLYDEIGKLDISDYEKYDSGKKELLSPVEVKIAEDITDTIPSDEELEALKGKTGKELIDDGFEYQYYSGDNQFSFNKYLSQYTFTFDGEIDEDKTDDEKVVYDLKVTDVQNSGFSDRILEVE